MKFLFRILKNQFVAYLLAEGIDVIEKAALERLLENQKRKRAPNKPKAITTTEGAENG